MACEDWIDFNGTEFINLSRTTQLALALGIDTLWVNPEDVAWIEDALSGVDYDDITDAPWYDPGFPASAEFAGIVSLSMSGLDDSTLEATTTEYITNGGNSNAPRNKTLPVVANVVLVASTERGAFYGKRWMDRVLRGGGTQMFCSGSTMTYFATEPVEGGTPVPVHRRDVSLTRGSSVTRKRSNDCSALWWVTFTLTANDPFEYGEEVPQVSGLGGDLPTYLPNLNEANPVPTTLTGYAAATGTARALSGGYLRITPTGASTDTYVVVDGEFSVMSLGMKAGHTYTLSAEAGAFAAGSGPADTRARTVGLYARNAGGGIIGGWFSPAATGVGQRVSVTFTLPATTANTSVRLYFGYSTSGYQDWRNITLTEGSVASLPLASASVGNVVLTETSCPVFNYTPIYDPLYPALVPPPTAPDFLPPGWTIEDGKTFKRYWARVAPTEPSALNLVPVLTLTTQVEARMVRMSVWPASVANSEQCDPLFSAIIMYLPTGGQFIIDGEQEASYVWDGVSAVVRRSDSLVYSPGAVPVEWEAFNSADGLFVALDTFNITGGYEGNGTIRATLDLVPKSD